MWLCKALNHDKLKEYKEKESVNYWVRKKKAEANSNEDLGIARLMARLVSIPNSFGIFSLLFKLL